MKLIIYIGFSLTILAFLRAWYWHKNFCRLDPRVDDQRLIQTWNNRYWLWLTGSTLLGCIFGILLIKWKQGCL